MNLENVRMLPNDAEEDVEVERADQEKINAFSSLNHRLNDIEDLLELKKDEKEQLEDLSMELELADEDEPILYKIASSFYHLKPEQASERVTKSLEELEASIDGLTQEADGCKEQMDSLKEVLYKKFGSAINLERD